jgi:hypothetical protein
MRKKVDSLGCCKVAPFVEKWILQTGICLHGGKSGERPVAVFQVEAADSGHVDK